MTKLMFPGPRRIRVRVIRKKTKVKQYPLCIVCGYPVCGPTYQMPGYQEPVHAYHQCQCCGSIETKQAQCCVCECELKNAPSYCTEHYLMHIDRRCGSCVRAQECKSCKKLRINWHQCGVTCRDYKICRKCAESRPCGCKALPYIDLTEYILRDLGDIVNEYIVPTCTDPDNPGADYYRTLHPASTKTTDPLFPAVVEDDGNTNIMIRDAKIAEAHRMYRASIMKIYPPRSKAKEEDPTLLKMSETSEDEDLPEDPQPQEALSWMQLLLHHWVYSVCVFSPISL